MRPTRSLAEAWVRSPSAPRRSWASVVMATRQPLPVSETWYSGGIRASVKNTWLNDACPFICRNWRTSTPGCSISRTK